MLPTWLYASRPCRCRVRVSPPVDFSRVALGLKKSASHRTPFCRSRAESTAAAVEAEPTNNASQPPMPPQPAQDIGVESELPKWESLLGRAQWGTIRPIVTSPFKYDTMTKVQAEVLGQLPELIALPDPDDPDPPCRDLLVRSRTGTGKTLAFLVPAIEARLAAIDRVVKQALTDAGLESDGELEGRARRAFVRQHAGALIVSPTRELATHIADEAAKLTQYHPGLEVRLFVGGMSKRQQMREWMRDRRDIIVGTPGRLRDVLQSEPEVARGLANTPLLILDDADTLINPEFREDIESIKKFLPSPPERQTFLFSATVPSAVQQMAKSFLSDNHTFISCLSGSNASPVHARIPQYHTVLPTAAHQIPSILRLLAHDQLTNPGSSKVIIFLPTAKMTVMFAKILRGVARQCLPAVRNVRVYELHSKLAQDARTESSDAFRADKFGASILVTSDVSARGVQYPGVTRVIQVGIPGDAEQYIRRVGRTDHARRTNSRSDLVLLPWEVSFVTWQLSKMPLKPLTVNELKAEVNELVAKHDADPRAYVHGLKIFRRFFPTRLAPILARIDHTDLCVNVDPEDIKQTFASLIGFYAEHAPKLRVRKSELLEGCKDWAVNAMGLPSPPHVGPTMLHRLGFRNHSKSGYSNSPNSRDSSSYPRSSSSAHYRPTSHSRPAWEDRGHARNSESGDSSYRGQRPSHSIDSRDPQDRRRSRNLDSDSRDYQDRRSSRSYPSEYNGGYRGPHRGQGPRDG